MTLKIIKNLFRTKRKGSSIENQVNFEPIFAWNTNKNSYTKQID